MRLTPERWQQVSRIYDLVADRDPSARKALLEEACQGDESLRREVESLLGQDHAVAVIDRSVWETAAPLFEGDPPLGPGATLGPYRIEGRLGAGGMGEVFRAIDTRLNRPVAIKVLPTGVALDQEVRARFAREARAVAALTHPHICTLYDVGRHDQVDFLVMECLDGDTMAARLRNGRLSFDEALSHAIEIAGALDHAHRHGIVHRDLKPANIMLTPGGAKLLDFGVAKFRPASIATPHDADLTSVTGVSDSVGALLSENLDGAGASLTRGGAILGTVRYMAPEQIVGAEVDARSDVFSFGAVVFEMMTGRRAFEGSHASGVRAAILNDEPPPVSSLQPLAPPALDEIVRRCLAKNPDQRWQTASDVMRELKHVSESIAQSTTASGIVRERSAWKAVAALLIAVIAGMTVWAVAGRGLRSSSASRPGQIRSVAVLPLDNLSADPEQEYFADGMTEQLIADLAKIGELRVIGRTSIMRYRDTQKPVPVIAQELQVDGVIEGSVVRAGEKVRITAKLIRGATGEIVWVQDYESDLRDVLALQRDVARAITSEIGMSLTPQEQARLAIAKPVDPDVHNQVLLGRYHIAKGTEEGFRKAVQYFEAAIARDGTNALAYAGLAEAYSELNGFYMDPKEAMPIAKRAAETAIHLDDSLADAHAALGYIHLVYDWDGPATEKELLRSLDLNPTLAIARLRYAAYLTSQARLDDAVLEVQRAIALDPLSIRAHVFGTLFLLFARHYDDAIDLARRGLELEPGSGFLVAFQGAAYAQQGRFGEAVANLQKAVQLDSSPTLRGLRAHVLAVAGQKGEALQLIRQVEEEAKGRYFCPYEIATAYVSLGDFDTACEWFKKGIAGRADCMAWLGMEPWMDPFHADPRWAAFVKDIGLTPIR